MIAKNDLVTLAGRLSCSARLFVLQLLVVVPIIHALLKTIGYNRTLSLLKRTVPANTKTIVIVEDPESYANGMRRLIRRLRIRFPFLGSCLSRSLAIWWLLLQKGIDSELLIGIQNGEDPFLAHAWVEYQGFPLNAGHRVRQRYSAFDAVLV